MEDYKPNSYKSKEDQNNPNEDKKKVEKVIKGTAKTKKKSGLAKFAGNFISDDVPNIKTYIFKDIVIPTIKKGISDTIDMILFGSSRGSKMNGSKVSYRSYYDSGRSTNYTETRTGYSYDDIVIESRGEAEEVLNQMCELISTYGIVSVADLYDLVGVSSNYTDNKYGWTNLRNGEVVRVRDGYMLKLPKALPIN